MLHAIYEMEIGEIRDGSFGRFVIYDASVLKNKICKKDRSSI